jgi:hypothetical protein
LDEFTHYNLEFTVFGLFGVPTFKLQLQLLTTNAMPTEE